MPVINEEAALKEADEILCTVTTEQAAMPSLAKYQEAAESKQEIRKGNSGSMNLCLAIRQTLPLKRFMLHGIDDVIAETAFGNCAQPRENRSLKGRPRCLSHPD